MKNNQTNAITVDSSIVNFFKNIDNRLKVIFVSSFIWGLFAHGMALFNKYSVHDDVANLFGVGQTYNLGRWFLAKLADLFSFLTASGHYSAPLINGIFSIMCIAISLYLMVNLLDIKHPVILVLLSGVMVTFPMVTALFGYMFTAPYYTLSLLMTTLGVFLLCRWKKWYTFLPGTFLLTLAVGIYQAFIPVAVSLMLFYFIKEVYDRDGCDEKTYWQSFAFEAIRLLLVCFVFMAAYFVINKYELTANQTTLSDYQGISSIQKIGSSQKSNSMKTSLIQIGISRLETTYMQFLNPTGLEGGTDDSMFPMQAIFFYRIMIVIMVALSVIKILQFRKSIAKMIQMTLLILMIPLCTNLIFVMSSSNAVHALMVYGQAMLFIYLAWLVDNLNLPIKNAANGFYTLTIVNMLLITCIYCRYDNICYLKAEYQQERTINYFTALIADIKATDGYKDEYPVTVINAGKLQDQTLQDIPQFSSIKPIPLHGTTFLINDYDWTVFMNYWCGYSPKWIDASEFADLPEVIKMPSYPDSGSIKVINNTVVIKF